MSRPWRPKPFLPLVGPLSGFQAAAGRALPLAVDAELVVIGGEAHGDLIRSQLAAIGIKAMIILEPVGRDTAPAIAAAASWVQGRRPGALVAMISADHHIPDEAAFRAAVRATLDTAAAGAIVTLGVRPTTPSTSYGYIRPGSGGDPVAPLEGFEEKPDAARAAALIASGALWNSGTFIAAAGTLQAEILRLAPEVALAVSRSLQGFDMAGGEGVLGAAFADAPSVAFDRAVMEKTDRGAVLPVAFEWSDLGAWDAVLAASEKDADGNSLVAGVEAFGARDVLGRTSPGVRLAVVGVSRLAVVVEPDAVLVCGLDASQEVRDAAHEPCPAVQFETLGAAADAYDTWLRTAALPLWATVGVDGATGEFREALTWDGRVADPYRRARVQARQAYVFATAAAEGLPGPWRAVAQTGLDAFLRRARREDGLFASVLDLAGAPIDATARLYEHAFILLALAGRHQGDPGGPDLDEADGLLTRLTSFRHPVGGFREIGEDAFQANASMHLFEAALAWEAVGGGPAWRALADELAELALTRFIDPRTGALPEFYDSQWRPLPGAEARIEPGHQFEWAWLLARWGAERGDSRGVAAAQGLFAAGRRGFDPVRGVVANALREDLTVLDAGARLWPQTEHLKAALLLGETEAALQATNGLWAYLDTPARGVWRERMRADGGFLHEPSPATSLYHLFLAIRELARAAPKPC